MPGPDPAEQRRLAEEEAARTSEVFFATQSPTAPSGFAAPSAASPGSFTAPQPDGGAQTDQDRQLAFLNTPVDRRIVAPDRVTPPASPYVLQAGSVIPAALITGIRSDLPGLITAQVTQNVYDSPSGRYLLLPQGSRMIGEYDNGGGFGQRRILLVWTRIILPNGHSIVLERQPGADSAGYAGLEDGVDHHWGGVLRAAVLSTLLNIGTELGADDDDPIASAIRDGAQDTIGDAGREIVRRQIDIPPTLSIRPGFPVRVIVTRDLILEPQGGH
jgi:type IV secretion system protein VirB10